MSAGLYGGVSLRDSHIPREQIMVLLSGPERWLCVLIAPLVFRPQCQAPMTHPTRHHPSVSSSWLTLTPAAPFDSSQQSSPRSLKLLPLFIAENGHTQAETLTTNYQTALFSVGHELSLFLWVFYEKCFCLSSLPLNLLLFGHYDMRFACLLKISTYWCSSEAIN